jgi:hypothetical protein
LLDCITTDHLVCSKSVLKDPLEAVQKHVECLFEILLEPWLVGEDALHHAAHQGWVRAAIDRADVKQLRHVKDLVRVDDIVVHFKREVAAITFHVLREAKHYHEHDFESAIRLPSETLLGVSVWNALPTGVETLVQVDLYLFKVVVFPHILKEIIYEFDSLREFYDIGPKSAKVLIQQKFKFFG